MPESQSSVDQLILKETLVAKHRRTFDHCNLPPSTRFIQSPYQIQSHELDLWYQQIEYPEPQPLPKPIFSTLQEQDNANTNPKT